MHYKNKNKKVLQAVMATIVIVVVIVISFAASAFASGFMDKGKNIIFMVPDGMGHANVTAARIYKNGLDGKPLNLESLETIGIQKTYSKNSTITDSAPAASAWACGEKFNNGEICKHSEGLPNNRTILELAKQKKKSTGIVATSQITHATPAAFAAHVTNRNCQNEIARQYIMETKPDVILGGGRQKFDTDPATDRDSNGCPQYGEDLAEVAQRKGYSFVRTTNEMEDAVNQGKTKLLGLFSDAGMTPAYLRHPGTTEPTLAGMTQAALQILENNPRGFFLMVEGSQIDWANHAKNFEYQVGDVLAFDDAVGLVLNWIDDAGHPDRKRNTLLIIAPDHETGGFAINGPYGALSTAGDLITIQAGWTFPGSEEANHTGGDVIVYSQGPGTKARGTYPGLGRLFDNTELYGVMKNAMGIN
ncbi:MAG: alkaline phosphatase [Syntrophorhabdus aromaticivorans]|uniref:Alkaline phosphatase n=1 Tax=Syntrophorhabdus aromaticivorans TaxID=328301 RepID=A0A971S0N3_9BACT|nr:alkaline phosphatase [Syntrophorhabdus aromaticivorans]